MVVESGKPPAIDQFNQHFDTVLEELGNFGKYQKLNYLLIIIPILFNGFFTTSYIFTAEDTKHRCLIAECDGSTVIQEPPWLVNAIPLIDKDKFDSCQRFSLNETLVSSDENSTCPSHLFDQNRTEICENWIYEDNNSIFDLGCDDWKKTLVGTINNIGQFICMPLSGLVSDKYGRRTVLVGGIAISGVIGVMKSFSPTYWWFLAFEFLEPALGSGVYAAAFIIGVELVGPKHRVIGSTAVSASYSIGEILLGIIAYFFPYWRTLLRVIYAPAILLFCYFWLIPESIRWLISRGRTEDAEKVLRRVADVNKITLSAKSLEILNTSKTDLTDNDKNSSLSVLKVIKSPILMVRLICCSFWWITCTFDYYGLSLNSVSLAGNIYLNFILVSLVELPSYVVYYYTIDRYGRRKCLCLSFLGGGISCIAFAFVPAEIFWLRTSLYLFGKFCITIAFTAVYVYTTEIFPTQLRHSLLGTCSMFGRLGSIIAPQTPLLSVFMESLPMILFGVTSIISGVTVLFFPETLNLKLPDTIEEAENISKNKNAQ